MFDWRLIFDKLLLFSGRILVAVFFAALVFLAAFFPLYQKALIALPVSVSIDALPAVSGISVREVYFSDGVFLSRDMPPAGSRTWKSTKKTWVRSVRIFLPAAHFSKVNTVTIKIDSNESVHSTAKLRAEWKQTLVGDSLMLESPESLRVSSSNVGLFQNFTNWPGDEKFFVAGTVRLAVIIAILAVLLSAIKLIIVLKPRWSAWFKKASEPFGQRTFLVMGLVVVLGVAIRFWASVIAGTNTHIPIWTLIAEGAKQGGNIYTNTLNYYHYGPVWSWVLGAIYWLAGFDQTDFIYAVSIFLTLADLGIFAVLWRKCGKLAAAVYFLSPIAIIVTGFMMQFENLALLAGLLAVLVYGEDLSPGLSRRKVGGLLLLGVSLSIKHFLFAFPLWIAVKQKGWKEKCVVMSLPIAVFLGGFLPYWSGAKAAILQNVFLYQALGGTAILRVSKLVLGEARGGLLASFLFFASLAIFAFLFKRQNLFKSLIIYGVILVLFTSSIAVSYFIIAMLAAAVLLSEFFTAFILAASLVLAVAFFTPYPNPTLYSLPDYFFPLIFLFMALIQLLPELLPERFKAYVFKQLQ